MSILVGTETRLIVQGITGNEGLYHAKGCRDYGTQVVGGATPGKGGTSIEGFPVLDMVKVKESLADHPGTRLVGPNCPGVISPGKAKVGIMPGRIHLPG